MVFLATALAEVYVKIAAARENISLLMEKADIIGYKAQVSKKRAGAFCQPPSVLFTVAIKLVGNGERSVRDSHRIIADPAGCVLQRGNDWVCSRLAADRRRAVMGCGYVITVLDSCNRSRESGVRLA